MAKKQKTKTEVEPTPQVVKQPKVETPVNLSKKQIEILKSFQETSDQNESPLASAFFKKAKDFWKTKA